MQNPIHEAVVFLFFLVAMFCCMREGYDDYPRTWTAIGVVGFILSVLFVAKMSQTV